MFDIAFSINIFVLFQIDTIYDLPSDPNNTPLQKNKNKNKTKNPNHNLVSYKINILET